MIKIHNQAETDTTKHNYTHRVVATINGLVAMLYLIIDDDVPSDLIMLACKFEEETGNRLILIEELLPDGRVVQSYSAVSGKYQRTMGHYSAQVMRKVQAPKVERLASVI